MDIHIRDGRIREIVRMVPLEARSSQRDPGPPQPRTGRLISPRSSRIDRWSTPPATDDRRAAEVVVG